METRGWQDIAFIGVDVQAARGCPYAVLNCSCRLVASGWLDTGEPEALARQLKDMVEDWTSRSHGGVAVGIDAPRQPLPCRRQWSWRNGNWRPMAPRDKGHGRHCEVILKALGIANPQWTAGVEEAPAWMRLGFALFAALGGQPHVYEVFPSASYARLQGRHDVRVDIDFAQFDVGPKDMLDAVVAAVTVREFLAGRGVLVGGSDGLGAIVLPGKLPPDAPLMLLQYPGGQPTG